MKTMDNKEILQLGKDLHMAKIQVLKQHGFSCTEIAAIMHVPESVVRRLNDSANSEV